MFRAKLTIQDKEDIIDLCYKELSTADISKLYNCSINTVRRYLKANNIKPRGNSLSVKNIKNIVDLFNQGYTSVKIKEITGFERSTIRKILNSKGLKLKSSIERSKEAFGHLSRKWSGYKEISRSRWACIKDGATVRNIDFLISIEDAWNVWEKSGGICPYSGFKLSHPITHSQFKSGDWSASLDRIQSSIGYLESNIQWVHKDVNKMKFIFDESLFLNLCELITYPLIKIPEFIPEVTLNRLFYNTKKGAKARNLCFCITKNDIINMYNKQNGMCKLTGLPVIFKSTSLDSKECTGSVDRINSDLGYTVENIQIVHRNVNSMKWNLNPSYFKSLCVKITQYQKELKNALNQS